METPNGDPNVVEDESGRSKAFLLRGTSSSSESLMPRPTEPSVDSLEALQYSVSGKPNQNPNSSEAAMSPPRDVETQSTAAHNGSSEYTDDPSSETTSRGGSLARAMTRVRRADVVLSDMSPSFTGNRDTDQARAAGLMLDALAVCAGDENIRCNSEESAVSAQEIGEREEESGMANDVGRRGLLASGGTFLGKFFAGSDENEIKREASRLFRRVRIVKPPASRARSSEMYLLGTGFLQE